MTRVAVITGSGRGIGRGIALALARRNWSIVVNYHNNAVAANQTVADIQAEHADAIAIQADIADLSQHADFLRKVMARYSRIDMLVNNAGMAPRQRVDLLEVSEQSYDEVLATNLKGPFFLSQRVAHIMLGQFEAATQTNYHPTIVNIGSISAYTSSVNRAEYCISKAGLAMVTTLFADRLADTGINVYEIRPGIVDTDMTSVAKLKYDALIAQGLTPIRRWGNPDDVGLAVAAIGEGLLPMSTGEVINVDGGFHMRRL